MVIYIGGRIKGEEGGRQFHLRLPRQKILYHRSRTARCTTANASSEPGESANSYVRWMNRNRNGEEKVTEDSPEGPMHGSSVGQPTGIPLTPLEG